MTERSGQSNLVDVIPALAVVLESLGYTIKEWNTTFPPYDLFALHKLNLPIIVNVFDTSVEIACYWPCTEKAKEHPHSFLIMVNSMNVLCRLLTCGVDADRMTMRACYPFAFAPDLFRSFMELWMDDAEGVLAVVRRENLGFLDVEIACVH